MRWLTMNNYKFRFLTWWLMLKLFILYHHFKSLTMNIHKFWHFYLMIEAVTVGGVRWMVSLPPTSSRTRALNRESLFKTCGGWCSTMKVLKHTEASYKDRWNWEHYSLIYGVSIWNSKKNVLHLFKWLSIHLIMQTLHCLLLSYWN